MKDYTNNPPAKFTGELYGKKVSIELDHSDLDMYELMDAFKNIALSLGFMEGTWNDWVKETAYEIEMDERAEEWNEEEAENQYENEFPNGEGYDDWELRQWNNDNDEINDKEYIDYNNDNDDDNAEFDWDKDVDTDYIENQKPEENTESGKE